MSRKKTVFYQLRASLLREGMSTADGQDLTEDAQDSGNGWVSAHVYTPSGDPGEDDASYSAPEARMWRAEDLVDMAVFPDTRVDGRAAGARRGSRA